MFRWGYTCLLVFLTMRPYVFFDRERASSGDDGRVEKPHEKFMYENAVRTEMTMKRLILTWFDPVPGYFFV